MNNKGTDEVDLLRRIIDPRIEELRRGKLGNRFTIEGTKWRCITRGRNIVYNVQCNCEWYAKIPVRDNSAMLEMECTGYQRVGELRSISSRFVLPERVYLNDDRQYILTAAVRGEYLQSSLYGAIISLRPIRLRNLEMNYRTLGEFVARMHRNIGIDGVEQSTRPTAIQECNVLLQRLCQRDSVVKLIEEFSSRFESDDRATFIHGNLRRENVLSVGDGGICLIDFENSGRGSRYDDLSKLVGGLVLTQTVFGFPFRGVQHAISGFIGGYRAVWEYDQRKLFNYLAARVSHQLLCHLLGKRPTIARIPVSLSRTVKLLNALMAGETSGVLRGLEL